MTTGSEPPSPGSFYATIRERQEQAAARKRAAELAEATQSSKSGAAKTSQTLDHVPGQETAKRLATKTMEIVTGELTWSRRQTATAGGGVLAILMICLVSLVVATSATPPTPTLVPLPVVNSRQVVDYLISAGITLSNFQEYEPKARLWDVADGVGFDVVQGNSQGSFVLLSYGSPANAGMDAFRVSISTQFRGWKLTQVASIILMASPETAPQLDAEIASHLTQYLIAPYRSFIPTATPRA